MLYTQKFNLLFERIKNKPPIRVAVVWPNSRESLEGAVKAAQYGAINPILIGNTKKITAIAQEANLDINEYEIINTELDNASRIAVQYAKQGKAVAIMKGSLHTDALMAEVVRKENGLRTGRRMSHCILADFPHYKKLLCITDPALNIFPNLQDKIDITKNAIAFMHALGIAIPKVALLSAVETVSANIPSTLDYAEICKMAQRGEISNAIIEGPLAFDLAISKQAAVSKNFKSQVSGDPDIVVAPSLEAANILLKALVYLADGVGYGLVLGAKVPIIVVSRAAKIDERIGSCMLAKFLC